MDLFFIILVIITVLFWIDLFIPDPLPFADEAILGMLMIGGWIIYALGFMISGGLNVIAQLTSPLGIILTVMVVIGILIWKFNLLDLPGLQKSNKKRRSRR